MRHVPLQVIEIWRGVARGEEKAYSSLCSNQVSSDQSIWERCELYAEKILFITKSRNFKIFFERRWTFLIFEKKNIYISCLGRTIRRTAINGSDCIDADLNKNILLLRICLAINGFLTVEKIKHRFPFYVRTTYFFFANSIYISEVKTEAFNKLMRVTIFFY